MYLSPNAPYTYNWSIGDVIGRVKASMNDGPLKWYDFLITETGRIIKAKADSIILTINGGTVALTGAYHTTAYIEALLLKYDGSLNQPE